MIFAYILKRITTHILCLDIGMAHGVYMFNMNI